MESEMRVGRVSLSDRTGMRHEVQAMRADYNLSGVINSSVQTIAEMQEALLELQGQVSKLGGSFILPNVTIPSDEEVDHIGGITEILQRQSDEFQRLVGVLQATNKRLGEILK